MIGSLTIHHLPLLIQPTLGNIMSPLQHDVVTLQSVVEVIPRRSDHRILALEILDDLVGLRLPLSVRNSTETLTKMRKSRRSHHNDRM